MSPGHLLISLNLGFFTFEFLLKPVGKTGLVPGLGTSDEPARAGVQPDAHTALPAVQSPLFWLDWVHTMLLIQYFGDGSWR